MVVQDRGSTSWASLDVDLSPVPEIDGVPCARLGRAADAIEPVAAYAAHATAKGQPWALARAARALAADARPMPRSTNAYGIALATHEGTLDVFERARTLLAYGSSLRRLLPPGGRATAAEGSGAMRSFGSARGPGPTRRQTSSPPPVRR